MAATTNDVRRPKRGSDVFSVSFNQSGSESAQIPVRLGMYALLKPLGRGGMARVFLADHVAMKRLAAIKVLPCSAANDPVQLERFYREARALAAIDHPNVVRAYDVREADGFHFLVMEFVAGIDLETAIRERGPLPIIDAVEYIVQAAAGLAHAHRQGLVHRDVKPANLLLDRAGIVKVLDLGLARFHNDQDDRLTDELDNGAVMCTPDFVAPEQAAGQEVGPKADIYSLGATLYALLLGKPPFEGSVTQKLIAHQAQSPRPIHRIRPDVPRELGEIVARMMSKKPANRQASMASVIQDLSSFKRPDFAIGLSDTERLQRTVPIADWGAIVASADANAPGPFFGQHTSLARKLSLAAAIVLSMVGAFILILRK